MKNILSFCLGFLLFSCQQRGAVSQKTVTEQAQKNCMAQIIALDDSLGKVRNHACEMISLSETIRQYVSSLEKLDYRNCREAFSTGFKKHREAWLALLPVTDQYPDLRGEMHDLFKQLEAGEHAEQFKPLVKSVWDTWAEIEAAMKN